MKINLLNLVTFYDVNVDVRPHSNAIKTLAGEELCISLLRHYFASTSDTVTERQAEKIAAKGAWLDAWLKVTNNRNQSEIYYQIEVKNWSFHGYGGGKPLRIDGPIETEREFKKKVWSGYWNKDEKKFKEPRLNKVLTRMNQFQDKRVEPLACLWETMHPDGIDEPFFKIPCQSEKFECVSVFSVSAYLRNLIRLGQTKLDVDLPFTQIRICHINSIFS